MTKGTTSDSRYAIWVLSAINIMELAATGLPITRILELCVVEDDGATLCNRASQDYVIQQEKMAALQAHLDYCKKKGMPAGITLTFQCVPALFSHVMNAVLAVLERCSCCALFESLPC